MAENSLMAP